MAAHPCNRYPLSRYGVAQHQALVVRPNLHHRYAHEDDVDIRAVAPLLGAADQQLGQAHDVLPKGEGPLKRCNWLSLFHDHGTLTGVHGS